MKKQQEFYVITKKKMKRRHHPFCLDIRGNHISTTKYKQMKTKPSHIFDDSGTVPMTFCEGPKRAAYFRTSNASTSPLGEWHLSWQQEFSSHQIEVPFKEIARRADVQLTANTVAEFQHSNISREEVNDRKLDYQKEGIQVCWVVDAECDVSVRKHHIADQYIMEFNRGYWKYTSFEDYNSIYLDVHGSIYQLFPKSVKNHMVVVHPPISSRNELVVQLNKENPFQHRDPLEQNQIFVSQKGPGNGKTYSIVQLIQKNEVPDTFIYMSHKKSAIHVIHTEFEDQEKRGDLNDIEFGDWEHISKNKVQCLFRTKKEPDRQRRIIIATVDSFNCACSMYSINMIQALGKFTKLAETLIEHELNVRGSGHNKFAGGVKFNNKLLLVQDETQDLPEVYGRAILRIANEYHISVHVVGDILQSLSIENSAFAYLRNLDEKNIYIDQPSNIIRRTSSPAQIEFINHMVPYTKYGLDMLKAHKTGVEPNKDDLEFIEGEVIPQYLSMDSIKVSAEADKLMGYYKYQVETYKRKPEDFLIVTPFVSNSPPLISAFNRRINDFWNMRRDDMYMGHSYLHASNDGASIDLNDSKYKTRISSIHTAKGDGRPVVFVIGVTERALCRYSRRKGNLIYDSLVNVCTTRQKEHLYFRVELNNDDIHQRISSYLHKTKHVFITPIRLFFPVEALKSNVKFENIITIDAESGFEYFKEHLLSTDYMTKLEKLRHPSYEKQTIDMKNHQYRGLAWFMVSHMIVYRRDKLEYIRGSQMCAKLIKIKNRTPQEYSSVSAYEEALRKVKTSKYFPILISPNKNRDHHKYGDQIMERVKKISTFLKRFFVSPKDANLEENVDYVDIYVMYHMMETADNGQCTSFPLTDLYEILNQYNNKNTVEKDAYKVAHHEMIYRLYGMWEWIFKKYPTADVRFNLKIELSPQTEKSPIGTHYKTGSFTLYTKDEQTNHEDLIQIIMKPQLNGLNIVETLYPSVFSKFLMQNIKENTDNFKKFGKSKKQSVCVFSLDLVEPYFIDCKDFTDQHHTNIREMICNRWTQLLVDQCTPLMEWLIDHCTHRQKSISKFVDGLLCEISESMYNFSKQFSKNDKPLSFIYDVVLEFHSRLLRTEKKNRKEEFDTFQRQVHDNFKRRIRDTVEKFCLIQKDDDDDY